MVTLFMSHLWENDSFFKSCITKLHCWAPGQRKLENILQSNWKCNWINIYLNVLEVDRSPVDKWRQGSELSHMEENGSVHRLENWLLLCFYHLWLHQLMSLSLLHLSCHHSQPIVLYCWGSIQRLVIRNNHFQLLERGPVFFVIFFSLFLSWSIKICSTFCHPLFASAVTAWSCSAVIFHSVFAPLHLHHLHFRLALPRCNQSILHTHKGIRLSLLRATTGTTSQPAHSIISVSFLPAGSSSHVKQMHPSFLDWWSHGSFWRSVNLIFYLPV